jgi:hypothetical protein
MAYESMHWTIAYSKSNFFIFYEIIMNWPAWVCPICRFLSASALKYESVMSNSIARKRIVEMIWFAGESDNNGINIDNL